ncbi:hypothetical protein [Novosphingopyxis sp.]|uniref:hypothetical protein n=1 Tax=Novosphingopyxis sp. TaxID=2709690 RepID=UPI003B5C0279
MMIAGVFVPQVILLALAGLFGASIPVLLGRFVLSQKDRNDNDQKRYENSRQLLADSATNATALQAALGKALKKANPGVDDVVTIMNAGAAYFANLQSMAQAILDGRVSESTRTQSLVPRIVDAMEKSLPAYYDALTRLSEGRNSFCWRV